MSINRWKDKENVVHGKKDEILKFRSKLVEMGENILCKVSWGQEDNCYIFSLL